jgi:signal transduction histidine kinase
VTAFRRVLARSSLRLRLVLIATFAVTVMVAAGGLLTIVLVREEYLDSADWLVRVRATEVADSAEAGLLPARLPDDRIRGTKIQVVRAGHVVSRTRDLRFHAAFDLPRLQPGEQHTLDVEALPGLGEGPFHVAAVGVGSSEGPLTVYAIVSTEDLDDVIEAELSAGTLGLAVLLTPLALLLWVVIGRTLGPVEAIRRRADVITAADLSERVPEPDRLDEIGRLARTINAMLERLDVGVREQRRFLADAAHELRSPVASLRAQLEAPQRVDGDLRSDTDTAGLLADTLRMGALVEQLLLLARSDAEVLDHVRAVVDLDETVDTVLRVGQFEQQRPAVTIDVWRVNPVKVIGDPFLLEQVVRNLLDNAVRHATGRVEVTLSRVGGEAVLAVDDDGPGIPPERRADVLRRFARLDDARDRDQGGTGLGLAIVDDVVRAHHGAVEILDSPLGGARLQVRLPADSEDTPHL